MKELMHKIKKTISKVIYFISLIVVIISGCKDEPELWDPKSDELQITEYITEHDSVYSEFKKVMDIGNMSSLLSTRGPFTLFLPDNEAMEAFYTKEGISSVDDLDSVYCRKLVLYHVTPGYISSTDVPVGALPEPNGLGDYLVSDHMEGYVYINKKSAVTDENIIVANGIIHRINNVIDIVTKNTIEVLEESESLTIFTEGLKHAGIDDTLKVISIPFGRIDVRTRYTILAVPDSVYAAVNINSVDDLIARFDDGEGALTEITNGFYKYMDYHCLEGAYYTSSIIETTTYPTLSREGLVNITDDYEINYDSNTDNYTGFILESSNINAKNGVIHIVDTILEEKELAPETIHFETTDFPDLRSLDCFRTEIRNFMDPENSFEKIKWKTAPYLQYYYKLGEPCSYNDCIVMAEGYWELEVTIPKIKKGKYEIWIRMKKGGNRANLAIYFDDRRKEEVIIMTDEFAYVEFYIFDVNWEKTTEHVVKLKTVTPGIVMFDWIEFRPIVE